MEGGFRVGAVGAGISPYYGVPHILARTVHCRSGVSGNGGVDYLVVIVAQPYASVLVVEHDAVDHFALSRQPDGSTLVIDIHTFACGIVEESAAVYDILRMSGMGGYVESASLGGVVTDKETLLYAEGRGADGGGGAARHVDAASFVGIGDGGARR